MGANPYAFDGGNKANAASLNAVTADIAARLAMLEGLAPSIEAAKDSLVAIGLDRLNTELLPTIQIEQQRVERGVLIAGSSTPAALVLGATLNMTVDVADRLTFSPSAFVFLARISTLHDHAVLRTTNWDTGTGVYTGNVESFEGYPGPWADWQLGSLAGSLVAQISMLARVEGARDTVVAEAAQVATDRAAVQRLNDRITVSTLAPTGGQDGDLWFKV